VAGRKKAEFTDKTRRTLAGRAGYQCSYPGCKIFCIGPHSDGERTVSIGVAAHIKGAADGSARYDSEQTDEERKHISNGIWMCWNHSVEIDNDEKEFSEETLLEWKGKRESEAKKQYGKSVDPLQPGTVGLERSDDIYRLDTDGKYRSNGLTVTYDPWKCAWFTMVKLNVEGEIESPNEMVPLAVNSVKAYLVSVGLRGQYLHLLAQMQDLKLRPISQSAPPQWQKQFEEFKSEMMDIDWSNTPGIEGMVFDVIAGDVKGTGEWDTFIIDITSLYPHIYTRYMDSK